MRLYDHVFSLISYYYFQIFFVADALPLIEPPPCRYAGKMPFHASNVYFLFFFFFFSLLLYFFTGNITDAISFFSCFFMMRCLLRYFAIVVTRVAVSISDSAIRDY